MAFRSQDLIVNALPAGAVDALRLCIWGTRICIRPTIHCRWQPTFVTCWRWTHITCWRGTCFQFSNCGFVSPCPQFSDPCGALPSQCPAGTIPEFTDFTTVINPGAIVINDAADIKTLRVQLSEVMEKLEELEQRGLEAGMHSPEELEQMETQLRDALNEVQSARKQGRPGGEGGEGGEGGQGGQAGQGGQGRKK
jgi:hypothetical protein